MLLTDDAADWAESHPDAVGLLAEPEPTEAAVDNFRTLFREMFSTNAVEMERSRRHLKEVSTID